MSIKCCCAIYVFFVLKSVWLHYNFYINFSSFLFLFFFFFCSILFGDSNPINKGCFLLAHRFVARKEKSRNIVRSLYASKVNQINAQFVPCAVKFLKFLRVVDNYKVKRAN